MAITCKSERLPNINKTSNIGPGSYLPVDNDYGKIEPAKIPFNSSTEKINPTDHKNTSPGPGAYFKNNQLSEIKSLMQGDQSVYKILDYDEIAKNSKFAKLLQDKIKPTGFMIKDQRFTSKKENNIPGPGYYNRTDLNFFEHSTTKQQEQNIIKGRTGVAFYPKDEKFQGPVSIPSNEKCFGYRINDNGSIVQNPKKIKASEEVDIFKQTMSRWTSKAGLTGVWSKSKTKKSEKTEKQKEQEKMFRATDNDFRTTLNDSKLSSNQFLVTESGFYSPKKTHSVFNMTNYFKLRTTNIYNITKRQSEKPKDEITKLLEIKKSETPGPGYYFQTDPSKTTTGEGFQFFKSASSRFKNEVLENPGPGAYFKSNEETLKRKHIKVCKTVNRLNKKRNYHSYKPRSASVTEVLSPGPCEYSTQIKWNIKLNKSSKAIFGSTENRFTTTNSKEDNRNGPGSYLPINLTDRTEKKGKLLMKALTRKRLADEIKLTKPVPIQINKLPSVGHYNPDTIFNIDYKLHKKVLKVSSVFVPFNSLQRRFSKVKRDKTKLNIGPGYYHKEKKLLTEPSFPFTSSSNRPALFDKAKQGAPGAYNLNSWFDWNKKTFNINYI